MVTNIKSISENIISGHRYFVRADLNLPIQSGKVLDYARLYAALPTIKKIILNGGSVVLASHLGRPSGEGYEDDFSLSPIYQALLKLLPDIKVFFSKSLDFSNEVFQKASSLKSNQLLLLENLRFHSGEKSNCENLALDLSHLADHYVNDAFGTIHREHCSIVSLPKAFRKKNGMCLAGLLLKKELVYLRESLDFPKSPFVSILGGSKISDKLKVVRNLLQKSDRVLIGGAMAYTFLVAKGLNVGNSLVDINYINEARDLLEDAGARILLPIDHICVENFDSKVGCLKSEIPKSKIGLDIGIKTISKFVEILSSASTIVWNGPMGKFEDFPFDNGTNKVADAVAEATNRGALTIIGGGDSAAALLKRDLVDKVSHVSTGGGASLAILGDQEIEGLKVLDFV